MKNNLSNFSRIFELNFEHYFRKVTQIDSHGENPTLKLCQVIPKYQKGPTYIESLLEKKRILAKIP